VLIDLHEHLLFHVRVQAASAAALAAAVALADTKATEEEKALVMAEQAADQEIRSSALDADLAALKASYDAAVVTDAAAAIAAAQAAYDAVMNA
jgi:hypothetical protein